LNWEPGATLRPAEGTGAPGPRHAGRNPRARVRAADAPNAPGRVRSQFLTSRASAWEGNHRLMHRANPQAPGLSDHDRSTLTSRRTARTLPVLILLALAGLAAWQSSRGRDIAGPIAIAVTAAAALCAGLATWACPSGRPSAAVGWRLIALGCWV